MPYPSGFVAGDGSSIARPQFAMETSCRRVVLVTGDGDLEGFLYGEAISFLQELLSNGLGPCPTDGLVSHRFLGPSLIAVVLGHNYFLCLS